MPPYSIRTKRRQFGYFSSVLVGHCDAFPGRIIRIITRIQNRLPGVFVALARPLAMQYSAIMLRVLGSLSGLLIVGGFIAKFAVDIKFHLTWPIFIVSRGIRKLRFFALDSVHQARFNN